MENKSSSLMQEIVVLLSNNEPREQIENMLFNKGYDTYQTRSIIEECIKLRGAKKRTIGIALILLGALICLSSCIATLLSDSLSGSNFSLFGLTTLGIIVVFAGLTMVF